MTGLNSFSRLVRHRHGQAIARGLVAAITLLVTSATLTTAAPPDETDEPGPTTRPRSAVVSPPPKAVFRVYLLMGQSNMVGRDTRTLADQTDNPRILALNGDGQWVVAHEPMHVKGTGIGPGISFAAEMLKADPTVTIGLVPCAVGNTSLKRWSKGNDLYEAALVRARIAAQTGELSGVLWHQGEADSGKEENAKTYASRLEKMVTDFRRDLGRPRLPFVVGQIGTFFKESKPSFANTVRAAIKDLPAKAVNIGFADSDGLKDKGDHVHFSAAAQAEFGRRYAKAMQGLKE